jgi:heterodisulfide reductase subunit C
VIPVAQNNDFRDQVMAATPGGERLKDCIQCGTCGGSCPNGADMESTPRRLFALINAGDRDQVLDSNTMWMCVSCYLCTSRCPQEIPITDIMYTLKRMAVAEGHAAGTDGAALARTFTGYVNRFGRSFEFGIASRFYLTQKPASLLRMGPLGLSMFTRGRISLTPTRIRQVDQLQAIIDKAKELGGAS